MFARKFNPEFCQCFSFLIKVENGPTSRLVSYKLGKVVNLTLKRSLKHNDPVSEAISVFHNFAIHKDGNNTRAFVVAKYEIECFLHLH